MINAAKSEMGLMHVKVWSYTVGCADDDSPLLWFLFEGSCVSVINLQFMTTTTRKHVFLLPTC